MENNIRQKQIIALKPRGTEVGKITERMALEYNRPHSLMPNRMMKSKIYYVSDRSRIDSY
jgi:hypothetical protein